MKRTLADDFAKYDGTPPYDKLSPCYMDYIFGLDMLKHWNAITITELRQRLKQPLK